MNILLLILSTVFAAIAWHADTTPLTSFPQERVRVQSITRAMHGVTETVFVADDGSQFSCHQDKTGGCAADSMLAIQSRNEYVNIWHDDDEVVGIAHSNKLLWSQVGGNVSAKAFATSMSIALLLIAAIRIAIRSGAINRSRKDGASLEPPLTRLSGKADESARPHSPLQPPSSTAVTRDRA
ncbi:hypothetical protein [Uliginosibacterium sp. H1]|uniref:hypothetical protein n=1 Tax=Uliginosibacterium sp. H1 TaxID=3114757 RepID=UPI002E17F3A1|nr:hypothetical protein [Uliginosibacterium sp. H1]